MRWRYKLLFGDAGYYLYSYGREEDDNLDGLIRYDSNTEDLEVLKLCSKDVRFGKYGAEAACEHFCKVIKQGYPEEVYVCCG